MLEISYDISFLGKILFFLITELLQKHILIENVVVKGGSEVGVGVNAVTAKKLDIIAYWHLRKVKIKQNLMTTTEQNSNT